MKRLCAGVVLVLAWPVLAAGDILRVPEDYTTIQEAINIASPSQRDTISVAAGTYRERIFIRKTLVLQGRDGAENTTLDGEYSGNVITVNGVPRACIIEDFTVTGGDATHPDSVGAGIYLHQYASPTIQRCRLVGNRARAGGGLNAFVYSEPLVRDCWFADNEGGAAIVETNNPNGTTFAEFERCVFTRNHGVAVSTIRGGRSWLRNCTITHNNSDGVGAREFARVRVNNCIITFNEGGGIVRYDPTVCFTLLCNDVYANPSGNYIGTNPNDPCFSGRGSGDVSVDPCYQDSASNNFHLVDDSPLCDLKQPDACGVLGAYDDPCSGIINLCTTAVVEKTWGEVKTLFR